MYRRFCGKNPIIVGNLQSDRHSVYIYFAIQSFLKLVVFEIFTDV